MASILATAKVAIMAGERPPSLNEALSGVLGSISLTAWICLLLPQLITNYKSKSADGLSMAFLFVWLLGDVANLSGALVTNLAPTAIALAIYFCVADVVLITQCTYYNTINARRAARTRRRQTWNSESTVAHTSVETDGNDADGEEEDEEEPLLSRRRSSSIGLPGSHRRHATNVRRSESNNMDALTRIITGEDETPDRNPWLHNTLSLLAVWVVGIAGWFVSYRVGAWDSAAPVDDEPEAQEVETIVGLALGYLSAVCYLCARLPQIYKNWKNQSCEGLALLFFLLSLTGNLTYGASLFAYSQDGSYLLKALPWLLGSLGTMVEDSVIFVQFKLYAPKPREVKVIGSNGAV